MTPVRNIPRGRVSRREASVEASIVSALEAAGWAVRKFTARKANPDRICIRGGRVFLLEIKRPGETPDSLQAHAIDEWADYAPVAVVRSTAEAMAFADRVSMLEAVA